MVFISCKVPDSSHQNTPLNLTQTQTHPVTRTALPHPLLFHNFTSSSFSPIMPRDSVVSHGKSHHDLIELHCIAFICPAGPWECIFGFSASVCVFAFVCTLVYVHASPSVWSLESGMMMSSLRKTLCLFSTSCSYRKWFILSLMRDVERLTEACWILTKNMKIRQTVVGLWCRLQWPGPEVLALGDESVIQHVT